MVERTTEKIYKDILLKIESTFNNYRNILFTKFEDGTKISLIKENVNVINIFKNDVYVGCTDFNSIVEFVKNNKIKAEIINAINNNQSLTQEQRLRIKNSIMID